MKSHRPPLPSPHGQLHDFRHSLSEDESSSNDSENRGSTDSGARSPSSPGSSSSGSTSGTNKNYSIYSVRPGDSFWQIAEEQMGSGSRATELARYNGMTLYSIIHPGDKLKIPLRSSGVSSNQASNSSSGGGTGSGVRSPSSPASSSSGSTSGTNKNYSIYTVRPGDGFWRIAEEQMGSGSRATELARYNGMTLYSIIHPGDKLKIPR